MMTEANQDGSATNNGEGEGNAGGENISLSKSEYEELISLKATTGSLKRELKDAQKALQETSKAKETPTNESKPDIALLQKLEKVTLRQAGIEHQDDMELARSLSKKWGVDIDDLVLDDDFKVKLERQRVERNNTIATAGVKGGAGDTQAKNSTAYWKAKGQPPTPNDVPDRKTRAKIVREMLADATGSKIKFYNE